MNPSLLDPNNHVPEVSPDDDWGDAEGFSPETSSAAPHVLPPRRSVVDRPSVAPTENDRTGLRIGSNTMRAESPDSPQRLEVQELNATVVRLNQMAPAPPKVPRQLIFHERPAQKANPRKSAEESGQWGLDRRRPTHWILGAGAAVATVVVMGMMVLPAINAPNAPRPVPDAQPFVEEKIEGIEAMNLLLAKQPEAIKLFRAYATATQVDDVVPLLRDGSALKRTLQTNWHPLGISKEWEPATNCSWGVLEAPGHPCGLLQGTLPDQSRFSAYFTHEGNQLKLDWKATVGFGTATFGELASSQGDPGEIRGEISSAPFYTGIFPEADYQSYRLVSPDGENSIWCYARRGEAADESIVSVLRRGETDAELSRPTKITLRLEPGPSGALPNQWLVGEMLHLDWVTP